MTAQQRGGGRAQQEPLTLDEDDLNTRDRGTPNYMIQTDANSQSRGGKGLASRVDSFDVKPRTAEAGMRPTQKAIHTTQLDFKGKDSRNSKLKSAVGSAL